MELLRVRDLCYSYHSHISILRDICFSLEAGSCLCIAGANGSGKSTLLELIAGCMQPDSGEILLRGMPVSRKNHEDRPDSESRQSAGTRRTTGMVFQDPDNQLFMPTVWEDVAFGVMHRGVNPQTGRKRAMEVLEAVGAEHLADRHPYELSGGEKQRAAIASALILEPEILLLDEPTAALDPRSRRNIITLLQNLGCAKIIAGHDLDMMLDLDGEALFLYQGRIAARGRAAELLRDGPFLQSIDLELPLQIR